MPPAPAALPLAPAALAPAIAPGDPATPLPAASEPMRPALPELVPAAPAALPAGAGDPAIPVEPATPGLQLPAICIAPPRSESSEPQALPSTIEPRTAQVHVSKRIPMCLSIEPAWTSVVSDEAALWPGCSED
jgi:hypothetical protein